MADRSDTEVLEYKFGVDPQDAIRAATRFQKELTKRLKLIEKSEERLDKGIRKYITRVSTSKRVMEPVLNKQLRLYDATVKSIGESRAAIAKLRGEVGHYDKTIEELSAREKSASGDAAKDISKRIAELQTLKKAKEDALGKQVDEKDSQHEALKSIEATAAAARKEISEHALNPADLAEALKDTGEYLTGPISAILRKDIPGAFEAGTKIAADGISGTFKRLSKFTSGVGVASKAKGDVMGGMAGGGLKALGGLMGKMGGMFNMLSKIGPLLSAASSVMMSLVKLFIDAEGAAKDFNKEILATAGSSSFLHGNLKNVDAASKQLQQQLGKMYDASTDFFDNNRWGINKEMHAALTNALTAEGVDLKKLGDRFEDVGRGAIETTGYVKNFGTMTQMSVAYSRAFGVSLSEISQLQGEMMSELGMDLDSVQTQFQFMLKGAEESGIATNKFFGIIRSFSSDLSLFTLRMEDVTQVMMALGKAMNPRDAQKFLQMVTQQFKGMDLMGRTRATIIAGKGATKDVLQTDLSRRLAALGQDIENSIGEAGVGGEIAKLVANNDQEKIAKFMAAHQDKMTAEQKSAIWDASRMQSKLASNDAIDIASALKDASPMAIVDVLERQSMKMFGKPLEKLTGAQRLAAGQAINMGDEQVDQLFKMKRGIIQVQEDMLHKLSSGQDGLNSLTQAEVDALQKLGINSKDGNAATELAGKDANEVFNAMSMDQQKELQNSKTEINYQEKIAGFQQSLLDKVGILSDFFLNKFYNLVMGIWDAIVNIWNDLPDMFGGGSAEAKRAKAELQKAQAEEEARKKKTDKPSEQNKPFEAPLGITLDAGKTSPKTDTTKGAQSKASDTTDGKPLLPSAHAAKGKGAPTEKGQADTTASVDGLTKTVKRGVALGKPSSAYQSATTDSTLKAIRTALFEYYMYSNTDRNMLSLGLKNGTINPATFGASMIGGVQATGSTDASVAGMVGNARGGVVTGIAGDMASVTRFPPAPPGEGWAAVGQGEKITPAGRGGGGPMKVELELKGDLKRFIQARVVEGTAQFERNKRLR